MKGWMDLTWIEEQIHCLSQMHVAVHVRVALALIL